jgi:hypothetical protein
MRLAGRHLRSAPLAARKLITVTPARHLSSTTVMMVMVFRARRRPDTVGLPPTY